MAKSVVTGPDEESYQERGRRLSDEVAKALDADVLLCNGPIREPLDQVTIDNIRKLRSRRPNALLVLTTLGGSPDAGYRIARCFQRSYRRFSVCVDGPCASAGTLITLGANEVVMSDNGSLGPLDTQIAKTDELWEMSSGLTGLIALDAIRREAYDAFEESLVNLKVDLPNQLTLKTAMDVAVKLTTGLFGPVYAQIDPMKLGEDERALKIAEHYGRRLSSKAKSLKPGSIEKLLASYPSHSFIIDREEAEELFASVRAPSQVEEELLAHCGERARVPAELATITLMSTVVQPEEQNGQRDGEAENGAGDKKGGVQANGRGPDVPSPHPRGAG